MAEHATPMDVLVSHGPLLQIATFYGGEFAIYFHKKTYFWKGCMAGIIWISHSWGNETMQLYMVILMDFPYESALL